MSNSTQLLAYDLQYSASSTTPFLPSFHVCLYSYFIFVSIIYCTVGPTDNNKNNSNNNNNNNNNQANNRKKLKDSKSAPHLAKGEAGAVIPDASQTSQENSVGLSPAQKAKERVRTTGMHVIHMI